MMKETKFTPGPWEWDGDVWDYDYAEEAPWLIGKDNQIILKGEIECANKASAHLIAAAPELYMVLEEVFDEVENYMERTGRSVTWGEKAKAALAKARGEA